MKTSKWKEFTCLVFGHNWNETGVKRDTNSGIILEKYSRCSNCELESHDRSGYIKSFKARHGSLI
jgi:hypothetical protein